MEERLAVALLHAPAAEHAASAPIPTEWSSFAFRQGGAHLIWRSANCDAPLWDLSRTPGELLPAELASAAAALRAGLSFSEWFVSRTPQ